MHEFDKCIIFSIEGARITEGFIHEFELDEIKLFAQRGSAFLRPGETYLIYIYNSVKGECKYKGVLVKCDDDNAVFQNTSLISSVQKRDNTRVNIQLKYRIVSSFNKDDKNKVVKKRLERPIEITVLNVSARGVYFTCNDKLNVGFCFPLIFRETKKPIELKIEIVRREEYQRSYNYGCVFADISQKDMDEIFRFVLREQIEQRRRRIIF